MFYVGMSKSTFDFREAPVMRALHGSLLERDIMGFSLDAPVTDHYLVWQHREVLHGFVHICGVDVEPCDVDEAHVGGAQDGLEVVEGERDLVPHVLGVLRVAFGVDGGLTRTDQLPVGSLEYFGLVVADVQRPRPRIDRYSLHRLYLLTMTIDRVGFRPG